MSRGLVTGALESLVERQMRQDRVPGLAVGLIAEGRLVYSRGFGITSEEDPLPVTADTVFRIGSATKPFTATALMRLAEQRVLDLDAPIAEIIAGLRLRDAGAADVITLRMLLSHRSGMHNGPATYGGDGSQSLAELVAGLRQYPMVAAPDTVTSYSNLGFCLAGHLAERAAGAPFPSLIKELVTGPLGLDRTVFDPSVAMTYRLAQPHRPADANRLKVQHGASDNPCFYPGAYLFSTVRDVARFAIANLCGAGTLLHSDLVSAMQRRHSDWCLAGGIGYGLGLYLDSYRRWPRVGHDGNFLSFGCKYAFVPQLQAGAILMYNQYDSFRLGREIVFEALYAALFDMIDPPVRGAVEPPADDGRVAERLAAACGLYRGTGLEEARLDRDGDQAVLSFYDHTVRLTPVSSNIYLRTAGSDHEQAWHHIPYNISYAVSLGLPDEPGYIMINGRPYQRLREVA